MLMSDDKKKLATIIVNKAKSGKPEEMVEAPMEDGAEQDDSIAKETAAADLISAIESKDAKALAAAFSDLMELCEYSEPEMPESSEME